MNPTKIDLSKISDILDGLFDFEAYARDCKSNPNDSETKVIALYSEVDGTDQFAVVCDLAFGNSIGAALTKIPGPTATEATKSKTVPETIAENLYEVLNICSSIFADLVGKRVVIDKMFVPGQDIDEELKQSVKNAEELAALEYELERYDPGNIAFLQIPS